MIHFFLLYYHDGLAMIDDYTVLSSFLSWPIFFFIVEASAAERLTPRTPDLDWRSGVHPGDKYTLTKARGLTNRSVLARFRKVTLYFRKYGLSYVEACVAERLTPRTSDLEVRSSSFACRVVSLDKGFFSTLSLFTQVYKWVPATYRWGVILRWTSFPSRGE